MRGVSLLVLMVTVACGDNLLLPSPSLCEPLAGVRWQRLDYGPPPARRDAAIAYDVFRGRIVMFGGRGAGDTLLGDTWEWTGTYWTRIEPLLSPSARYGAVMAFDPTRAAVVMFGGKTADALSPETWEYADRTWRLRTPASPPGGRIEHAMAYDPKRHRVVMTGGSDIVHEALGTFLWDGSEWEKIFDLPRRSAGHAMVYDPRSAQLILAGGRAVPNGPAIDDAYALGPTSWEPLPAPGLPRVGGGAGYNGEQFGTWFVGGAPGILVWRYGAWELVADASGPIPPPGAAIAGYMRGRSLFAFGGQRGDGTLSDETLIGGVSGWSAYQAPPRNSFGDPFGAWQELRESALLFGNDRATQMLSVKQLDDGYPTEPTQSIGIGDRHDVLFAAHGDAFYVGGGISTLGDVLYPDLYAFRGEVRSAAPNNGPFPRARGAMAEDRRGDLVVFGGIGPSGKELEDTWRLVDQTWERADVVGPPGRSYGAMVVDGPRHVDVLFGGERAGQARADTWEWDGTAWTARADGPETARPRLTYDLERERVVLFRDAAYPGEPRIFEWDGEAWTPVCAEGEPEVSAGASALFYDRVERGVVVIGRGADASGPNEVWALRREPAHAREACSAGTLDVDGDGRFGCDDPDCAEQCRECGDTRCQPREQGRSCPIDCLRPDGVCGDFDCAPEEARLGTCPGDC